MLTFSRRPHRLLIALLSAALQGVAAGAEPESPARQPAVPGENGEDPTAAGEAADRLERRRRAFGNLKDVLKQQGSVRVIVELEIPQYAALRDAAVAARDAVASQQADAQVAQLIDVAARAEIGPLAGTNHDVNHVYASIPFMALRVGADALIILEASAGVVGIYEDVPDAPSLNNTVNIIGASAAWSGGPDGSGSYVAVLDTGIRSSHNMFAGKHIVQACFALGQDGAGGAGDCPNGQAIDTTSANAARHHATSPNSFHGTHVTGIAVGIAPAAVPPLFGVARGANIIAIQVFSQFRNDPGCSPPGSDCVRTWVSDQIRGLEHVYGLRNTYNIACVNMSLGGGQYSNQTTCDNEQAPRKSAIDNLRSVGIATIIASGNDGDCSAIDAPACISSAIAVGAATDGDVEASFSNFHSTLLDIYGPGVSIFSAWGTGDSDYVSLPGTSMAAPHVAGAWAVMKHALGGANVPVVLNALLARVRPVSGRCTPAPSMGRVHLGSIDCDGNGAPYVHETGPGRALQLDGVDDFARAPVAPLPVGSAPRTIECWFKRNNVPYNDDGLFTYGSLVNGQSFGVLFSTLAPGRLRFQGFNADFNGTLTVPMGVWNHMAVTYDGATVRMYLNGALDASSGLALNTASNETDGFQIGKRRDFLQQRFPGQIDEFRIWNHARTQTQIQASMNRSRRGNEPGLVSYWRFDEWSGQVLYDLTLSNNHGTCGNTSAAAGDDPQLVPSDAPVSNDCNINGMSDECEPDCNFNGIPDDCDIVSGFSSDCNLNGKPDECEVGRALQFDGTNDLARVRWPIALPVGNAPRTAEAWVYRNISGNNQAIFVYGTPVSGQIFGLITSVNCPNKLYFYGHAADACSASDLPVGAWTHVAVSWDGATLRLYINGQLEFSGPPSPGTTLNTTLDSTGLTVGVRPALAGSNWNGRIDEFRIWNHVRSQAQIQGGMLHPMTGAEPGLVGLWSFQETGGQFIADQSTSRRHGTLGATAGAASDDPSRTLSGALFAGAGDCNANGLPDECEQDCNGNAIPDDCEPLPAGVRLVAAGAPEGGDGTSWGRPFRTLQEALSAAAGSGGTITQIWVAAGTYRPDQTAANPLGTGSRSATFQLLNGVAIYGGFACGALDLSERDPAANVTILSGDLAENDGPNFANYGENSYHVVTGSGTNATAVLDGFTITGGNANGTNPDERGAGMTSVSGSPSIIRCRFVANRSQGAGGGVRLTGSSPSFTDCEFTGNTAVTSGGAMTLDTSHPLLLRCILTNNRTTGGNCDLDGGGGVKCAESSPTIRECVFEGNTTVCSGGAVFAHTSSNPIVEECEFRGNSATKGGAMASTFGVFGGGASQPSSPTVTESSFIGNSSIGVGGAVHTSNGGTTTLDRCRFFGNAAGDHTAAVFSAGTSTNMTDCVFVNHAQTPIRLDSNSSAAISDCAFVGNTGSQAIFSFGSSTAVIKRSIFAGQNIVGNGGTVTADNNSILTLSNCLLVGNVATGHGPTLRQRGGTFHILNSTIASNSAGGDGGGLWHDAFGGTSHIRNSILWGNTANNGALTNEAAQIFVSAGAATLNYSTIQDGDANDGVASLPAGTSGSNNRDRNPLFFSGPSGTWTSDASYDPTTGQTTLTNANANGGMGYAPDELVGMFLNPSTAQTRQTLIVSNTATTIVVWGNFASLIPAGGPYPPFQVTEYRLPVWSPCIDRGDPAFTPGPGETDLAGAARVSGCRVDMGAYEAATGGAQTGDMNGSGATDLADLPLFVQALLQGGESCAADINADGAVNGLDVQGFVALIVGS